MKIIEKPFKQIDRQYKITSAELRKALKLEGEILYMNLWKGRNPTQEEERKSEETDVWEIVTKEISKEAKKNE